MFKDRETRSPQNIDRPQIVILPKKDHDMKFIDWFKFELVDKKAHDRLIKRKKGTKLKVEDKIFLIKIMTAYQKEHNHIRSFYNLSYSTFHRLKKMMDSNFTGYQSLETLNRKEALLDGAIWSVIEAIVAPPQFPLTMKRISEEFWKFTNIKLSNYKLRKCLKTKIGYSFIRGSSRPPKITTQSHQLAKGCFACRILKLLLEGGMIFNCDESSFDRSVRENYSWLPTGIGGSIIGEPVGERSNLILSILPNGAWIAMIQDGTTDSQAFSFYLAVLSQLIEKSNKSNANIVKILIDNAAIHHSVATNRALRAFGIEAIYLPAYWSELVPVELWFKAVKSAIKKRYTFEKMKFSKESGKKAIITSLSWISREYMQRWWLEAINKLKEWIYNTLSLRDRLKKNTRDSQEEHKHSQF